MSIPQALKNITYTLIDYVDLIQLYYHIVILFAIILNIVCKYNLNNILCCINFLFLN